MEILILIAIPTFLVWGLVFLKHQHQTRANLIALLGFLILLAGSVFGYEFFHLSSGPIPVTLDRLMIVGWVALFAIFCFRGSESLGPINRADLVILALVLTIGASVVTHNWQFRDNLPVSRLLFLYLIPVAVYAVMRSTKLNVADLKWFSILLGGFGAYLALTAIAETREWTSWVFPRYIMNSSETEFLGRGRGPFLNPVTNGFFLVTCCCAMWMWWPKTKARGKFLLLLLTGLIGIGIFCTLTRSVWLSFLLATGLFFWCPASRQTRGLLIILATVVFVASIPWVGDKVHSFKRDKQVSQADMERSAQLRPLFAIVAWNMFKDQPVFGCGFGQYSGAKYPYLQDPYSGRPLAMTKSWMQHNVFLALLTETGLVGLLILLAMLAYMAGISWSLWNNEQLDYWSRCYGLLMMVVLLNYCVNGMFHDVSIMPMYNMLLFAMFAIVNNVYTTKGPFRIHSNSVQAARLDQQTGMPDTDRTRLPSTAATDRAVPGSTTGAKPRTEPRRFPIADW